MMKNDIKKKNSYSPSIPIGLLLLGMMGVSTQTRAVEAHGEDVLTTMKNMKRDEDPRVDGNNGEAEWNNISEIVKNCRVTHGLSLWEIMDLIPEREADQLLKNTTAYREEFKNDGYWHKYRASIKQEMKLIDDIIKKAPALIKLVYNEWVGDRMVIDHIIDNPRLSGIEGYKDQAERVYDLLTFTKENARDRIPLYRLAPLWRKVDLDMFVNSQYLHRVNDLVSDVERAIRSNSSLSSKASKELQEAVDDLKKSLSKLSFDGEDIDYAPRRMWLRIISWIRFSEKSKNEIKREVFRANSPDDNSPRESLAFWTSYMPPSGHN